MINIHVNMINIIGSLIISDDFLIIIFGEKEPYN